MSQYQSWEIIDFSRGNLDCYHHVSANGINKDLTIKLRKGFHDMAKLVDQFKEKEQDYLDFLEKRACFHPRCLFVQHHQKEVNADYLQLCQLRIRLLQLRDNILVVGDQKALPDITVVDCYMPGSGPSVDHAELGLAIYGINKN